ncbi:MAG TPA: nitroreductase family deazaflavin-dependent oxidoreductase [Actinomycetota bacterium]|jgi:deazaflavin-dependent oxidoreductase (nitroreductase family)
MSDWNTNVIEEFRANHGKVGGMFVGAPLLLLTTTGAKTGATRLNPLMYLPDGDRLVIFASKGGAPTHPDWFHNVKANPSVTVEVGDETYRAVATEVTGDERDGLFARQSELYPQFAEYQADNPRLIPVVVLERID